MNRPRRFATLIIGALLAAAWASSSVAATDASWPTRAVRILVGFPAGSTPDMSARTLAEPLSRALGQPVIVENRPDASGNIASDLVAKATDNHTLGVVINGNLTSAKLLYPQLPYDPAKDFTPVSLLTTAPLVLVAPANLPDGAVFFESAQRAGASWNDGSVGNGSVAHLGIELLKTKVSGLTPVHIPYGGNPQVATGMLGGQIQMALVPPGIAMPQVRAGKLKAIGVTGGRSVLVPELPTLADAGVRDFNLEVWTALVGPANLTAAAKTRLSQEVPRILREAETRQRLFNQGWQAVGTSPEGLVLRIREETRILGGIIEARKIKID